MMMSMAIMKYYVRLITTLTNASVSQCASTLMFTRVMGNVHHVLTDHRPAGKVGL